MAKLKPCPFCKCNGRTFKTDLGFGVECDKNGHSHYVGLFTTEEKAVAAWNFWVGDIVALLHD